MDRFHARPPGGHPDLPGDDPTPADSVSVRTADPAAPAGVTDPVVDTDPVWLQRLQQLSTMLIQRADRHPVAADAVLATVLAAVTLPDAVRQAESSTLAYILHFALWIPVAFRRQAPQVVFCLLGAIAFAQWLTRIELAADLALLIALYTVAAHCRRWQAVVAAALLEVGVVLAAIAWGHEDGPVREFVQLTGVVVAALLLGTTVRSRNAGFAVLKERADRLERERDQQSRLAAAAERARIAREMHDIVAHSLSVMITLADGALLTERREDARAAMTQVSRTGRDALADTRRVLGVLREQDSVVERQPQPVIGTLETLLTAVRATGLTVEMLVEGMVFAPTPTAQTALYRIVQEALTNTVKHAASATRVAIILRYAEPAVSVEIWDDGTSLASIGDASGHGLVGMRERAAMFGGSVTAGPDPAGGWRVAATLRSTDGGHS